MVEGAGWFARLFGQRAVGRLTAPLSISGLFSITDDLFNTSTPQGQYNSYIFNSVVRTVIDRRAEAFINGKWFNTLLDGKESNTAISKDFYALLNKPNGHQSSAEFKADLFRAMDIFGMAFILKVAPVGFNKPQGLVILPNQLLDYRFNWDKFPFQITTGNNLDKLKLQFTADGYSYTKDLMPNAENVIVIRNSNTPGTNTSRLQGLQDQINKLHIANNASNDILKHHGALGILSDDSKEGSISTPMTQRDTEAIQADYQNYGIGYDKWKLMITNKAIKYTPITLPIKDLMLNEATRDATRQICDALGYPIDLLGFEDGAKLSSTGGKMGEAKKMLYQDFIIPQAQIISDTFSRTEFKGLETINIDFSHVEPLQQSQVDLANRNLTLAQTYNTLVLAGIMTTEEARMECEFNEIITNGTKI